MSDAELEEDTKGPGVPVSPPLIAAITFGICYAISLIVPLPITGFLVQTIIGYMLMAVSGYFAIDGHIQLIRAKTNVPPWKPTTSIVKSGVFRLSRNPLYFSLCLLQLGLALVLDKAIIAVGALVCAMLIYYIAIRREEPYLEKKFGSDYLDYKKKVRRWI